MHDIRNYDDEMICPVCHAIGRIPKRKKIVSDLTVDEFRELMVDCFEMLKQRELDMSIKEYKRLTETFPHATKSTDFVK